MDVVDVVNKVITEIVERVDSLASARACVRASSDEGEDNKVARLKKRVKLDLVSLRGGSKW